MTATATPPRRKRPLHDWLRTTAVWGGVPGWVLSVAFHGLSFVVLMSVTQWPSCRGDYSGEDGTGFREIGLRTRDQGDGQPEGAGSQDRPDSSEDEESQTPDPPSGMSLSSDRPLDSPVISDEPPVAIDLPETPMSRSVIGVGPPPVRGIDTGNTLQTAAINTPGSGEKNSGSPGSREGSGVGQGDAHGTGQTSLFGINDAGKKFVYVIDRSYSMDEYGAFRAAKAELMQSINRLTDVQQFQVIFYNNEPLMLATRESRFRMFFGTDAQRLQVAEQLRAISPEGGTRHLSAVLEALKLNPDVIFLLTDAATELDRGEVDTIKSRNRQGTRIHCIEFGKGAPPKTPDGKLIPNFLKKLAEQNSGEYSYRDVRQFAGEKE